MSAVGDLKKQNDQLQGTSSYLWRALPIAATTAAAGYYYFSMSLLFDPVRSDGHIIARRCFSHHKPSDHHILTCREIDSSFEKSMLMT